MNWLLDSYKSQGDEPLVFIDTGDFLSVDCIRDMCEESVTNLKRQDLVAIETENSLESLVCYVGQIGKGIPTLLIDRNLSEEMKFNIYSTYGVSVVRRGNLDTRLRDCGPSMHRDLALLLSTSGSTGSPKLVRLSALNIKSNAMQICRYLELTSNDRAITTLPLHYSFGISVLNTHLICGGSIGVTSKKITERGFWDFFKLCQPTSLAGVPTTFQMLRRLGFKSMNLPSLRMMMQAGGRLAIEDVTFFADIARKKNCKFYVMYGQTEATARMAYLPDDEVLNRPGSIGKPIPEGRFWIVDQNGNPIDEPGVVGQLIYKGPNVMMGYANEKDDLALGDLQHGVLETGDLAETDPDGFYYIRGRLNRFIKLFGNRVNLDEIEGWLQSNGFEVFIAGHDDKIIVVAHEENSGKVSAKMIFEKYKFPLAGVDVLTVESFPRNEAGKIQYSSLVDLYRKTKAS